MNRAAGLKIAAMLLLKSATAGSALFAMHEEPLPQDEEIMAIWSGQSGGCLSEEQEALQSIASPVSLMECRTGGRGSVSCDIRCNRMFGFYYSDCSVECIDGYYACCNCNNGAICYCYLEHMELWPIRPNE